MRTLQDQLIEKGLSQVAGPEMDRKSTRTSDKREERLTDKELAYLKTPDIWTSEGRSF